ncbi:hypothetical protein Rhopal_002108-T1 [Rhodotorula paludigena]|uniref:Nucleolar protein 12 n=1 Tax=Rhodotorula paludigena TaxID=86838 RepID=A0AAV5GIW1_9BASI|nr:hypothetical protein Rhopal_002108-T1 [Rhodotorula paludigena]
MGKSKSKAASKQPEAAQGAAPAPAVGLSSFLLGQATAQDSDLADVFAHSKGRSLAFDPQRELPASTSTAPPAATSDSDEPDLSELESGAELSDDDGEEDGEEHGDVEEEYAAKLAAATLKKRKADATAAAQGRKRKAEEELDEEEEEEADEADEEEDPIEVDEDEDDEFDINDLVQETLRDAVDGVKGTKKSDKGKKAPKVSAKLEKRAQESPEERDARTIFLGNVPAECSTSRSLKKSLVRHVLQNPALTLPADCPPLKLDAIRFRSLAFASKVFGRKAHTGPTNPNEEPLAEGGRGRKRAREWRESEQSDLRGIKGGFKEREGAPAAPAAGARSAPMTDAQKRRVALIRGELNEGKKACNAYLVIEAVPEGVDVREVVNALVAANDNSVFEGFTLRADVVRPRSAAAVLAAAQMAAKPNANLTDVPRNQDVHQISAAEARRTLFIGGLDFAENEENVRKATEAVLARERGELAGGRYVENVRIVRDASSGLGKGFCYVLLADEQCVDELLALPPGKNLKISKRKVRLERCKTTAAAARAKASQRTAAAQPGAGPSSTKKAAPKPVRLAAPRDPSLGRPGFSNGGSKAGPSSARTTEHQSQLAEALSKLPTTERKKIKAMDPERIARRAGKKEQKRLAERYERKQANAAKKSGGPAEGVLGRESRAAERHRKEKKRIRLESKSTLKKKSQR